ncbi:alpha-hydroxy acid oxidase [Cryobacterium lyxosi]|jgi:isopentenyl diphosphate isomerase/L-lactate dehydrogenase-like FMN-dependent dehydrogenase|uniref:Alpha-hydroxy-acid oxidizing protein n=1 Tax=Cryobacterium lyxosi TaxID=1259228 RepID=A0A4R8ZJN1_9MICO|nr:alpha-hydroxy acid oxidase [Cryobacterium lyxosi]TFD27745.1 alpha-hydroxy-acid oxidizing protein [Cryobacterium lyxosi]
MSTLSEKMAQRRISGVRNSDDARRVARRQLPRAIFDYVDGGAEDEVTLGWNTQAFRDLAFEPRGGTWIADPILRTKVLGLDLSMPVLTAPCGGMRLVHPDGDIGIAAAASKAGIAHVATSASGFSLEEIAQTPGPQWFQAYRFSNQEAMKTLIHRAKAAGFEGLVATIDTSVAGNREKDFRNGFSYNMSINLANVVKMAPKMASRPGWVYRFMRDGMPFQLPNTADLTVDGKPMELTEMTRVGKDSHSPSWEDITWMRANWDGPLIVKGILNVADAERAKRIGVDGIIVSNHGGRQLDGAPATINVLPKIAEAVGDDVVVMLDSGIRRGSDVVKALSLGAKAVLIGRQPAWGLAIAGEYGVSHTLEILRTEMIRTMRLLGCPSVDHLDPTWVAERPLGRIVATRQ